MRHVLEAGIQLSYSSSGDGGGGSGSGGGGSSSGSGDSAMERLQGILQDEKRLKKECKGAFRKVDTDKNGNLSFKEITAAAKKVCKKLDIPMFSKV